MTTATYFSVVVWSVPNPPPPPSEYHVKLVILPIAYPKCLLLDLLL